MNSVPGFIAAIGHAGLIVIGAVVITAAVVVTIRAIGRELDRSS